MSHPPPQPLTSARGPAGQDRQVSPVFPDPTRGSNSPSPSLPKAARASAVAAILSLLLWLTPFAMVAGGCGPVSFTLGGRPGDQQLQAELVRTDPHAHGRRVAIVDVDGFLANQHESALLREGEHPVGLLDEKLHQAATDDRIRAVLLRLNTPGGTVTASDAMYRLVQNFRRETGKPVVALMTDVAASGGYYLACASDRIVAYPTSITGSIGVIFQTISVKPALERWGVRPEAIVSGPNKAIASPLTTLSDEQRRILQGLVDDFHQRFVDVVRSARNNIPEEQWAELTDGRIFTGAQAAELGLVDAAGDLDGALDEAKRLAGVDHADVVVYRRPLRYVGSPYAALGAGGSAVPGDPNGSTLGGASPAMSVVGRRVEAWIARRAEPGFYYFWRGAGP